LFIYTLFLYIALCLALCQPICRHSFAVSIVLFFEQKIKWQSWEIHVISPHFAVFFLCIPYHMRFCLFCISWSHMHRQNLWIVSIFSCFFYGVSCNFRLSPNVNFSFLSCGFGENVRLMCEIWENFVKMNRIGYLFFFCFFMRFILKTSRIFSMPDNPKTKSSVSPPHAYVWWETEQRLLHPISMISI